LRPGSGQFEGFASPGFVTVAEKSHTVFVIDVLIGLPGRIEPEGLFVVAQRLGKIAEPIMGGGHVDLRGGFVWSNSRELFILFDGFLGHQMPLRECACAT
jgi:hypothetical protein